jgi:hypothetical protein
MHKQLTQGLEDCGAADPGARVSEMATTPRKSYVQRTLMVCQFCRWNPHFLLLFEHVNGRWVSKHGKDGELRCRKQARQEAIQGV